MGLGSWGGFSNNGPQRTAGTAIIYYRVQLPTRGSASITPPLTSKRHWPLATATGPRGHGHGEYPITNSHPVVVVLLRTGLVQSQRPFSTCCNSAAADISYKLRDRSRLEFPSRL
jgi:hypothetical protein